MSERKKGLQPCVMAAAVAVALGMAGCGGGGSNVRPTAPPPPSGAGGGDQGPPTTLKGVFHIDFNKTTKTWSQDIDGKGNLVKEGTGTLILTGRDTYTGGTTISKGTLQIGNGGTTGSIIGDVTDNGTLVFDRSDDITFDGLISGSGLVAKQGEGGLTLAAANTYTGGTTISGGTLVVAHGGALGTGDVTLQGMSSYATLQVDKGVSLANHVVLGENAMLDNYGAAGGSMDNAVLGTGGTNTVVFNQEGGTITADVSAVRMTGGGSVANESAGLIQGGAFGVVLSHGGGVLNEGAGSTIRSKHGTAVFIGGAEGIVTNRKGGILTGGSTAVYMEHGGQLDNGEGATIATTGTHTGDCGSTGDCSIFVPSSSGSPHVLSLSNAGTIIGNVQLDIAAANSVMLWAGGSIRGNLDIGTEGLSSLSLNGAAGTTQRYSKAVTGATVFAGRLGKYGEGTWVIDDDALNMVSDTWISGGWLQVGDGGTQGSIGQGRVNIESGSLAFAHSDDMVFSGAITGEGVLYQNGTGTLTLTGANTYAGGTIVNGGTLELASGGTLGSGAIAVNGGRLKVGDTVALSNHIALSNEAILDNAGALTNDVDTSVVESSDNDVTVMNHDGGLIEGNAAGLLLHSGGTVNNASGGVIRGGGRAILIPGNAIVNNDSGSIIGTAGDGLVYDTGVVTNSNGGKIRGASNAGTTRGVLAHGNTSVNNVTGSTISGSDRAIWLLHGGTVVNDGSLVETLAGGGNHIAVEIDDPSGGLAGIVTNRNGARIAASNAGLVLKGYNSVHNIGHSRIEGDSLGVGLYGGGRVDNDNGSAISSESGTAIQFSGSGGDVANVGGSLVSGGRTGIHLGMGGMVTNGAGSTIRTTAAVSGDCRTDLVCAIYVNHDPDSGTASTLILSNAGTIIGDVKMDSAASNFVTLTAGGVIHGELDMGTDTQSDIRLDGDAGTTQRYSQAVTGTTTFAGDVDKRGAGTWTIDSDDLSSTRTIEIHGGVLKASVPLSGDIYVFGGGALDGAPGVGNSLSNAGKVVVHDVDTVVDGNYVQSSMATLAVNLGSKLDVSGTVALDGGTLLVTGADDGYVADTHTTVLAAGEGVSGTFDKLVKDAGVVFISSTIHYGANEVWLDTSGLDVTKAAKGGDVDYTSASMSGAVRVQAAFERANVALEATRMAPDGVSKGTAAAVPGMPDSAFLVAAGQFQQSPDLRAAQASLDSLSGQLHAASAAMTLQAIGVTGRAFSHRIDQVMAGGVEHGVWINDLKQGGGMARAGYTNVDYRLDGWLVGSDLALGPRTFVGFAMSQSDGSEHLSGRFDRNVSRDTAVMSYFGWAANHWYTHARVGLGHYRQSINRMLLLGAQYQGVWTDYTGHYNVAHGESGMHFRIGGMQLTPFVSVEFDRVTRGGFAEQGAGGFGLRADAQTLQRWQGGVGLKLAHQWQFGNGASMALDARIEQRHTLSASGEVFNASFTGVDAWQPLTGVGLSRRSTVVGLGLNAQPSANTHVRFGYDYLHGDRGRAGNASARFSMDW